MASPIALPEYCSDLFDTISVKTESSPTYGPNPFDILPIETNQLIATLLEYDSDLCNFRLICYSTHDAVDADNCSFWRRKFLACFEKPVKAMDNVAYKAAYQKRRLVIKCGAKFETGDSKRERECLEVLRDLVIDSFSEQTTENEDTTYESANLTQLKRFLTANNLITIIFQPPPVKQSRFSNKRSLPPPNPTPLLQTIQVLCTPMILSFEPHTVNETWGFPDSQAIVYSTANYYPIFGGCNGLDVNMEFILHNINFWKYHMVREIENTLYSAFCELEEHHRPRWWSSRIEQGGPRKLGRRWKGSYAYVNREDIEAMRDGDGDALNIQDLFAGEDHAFRFQDMELEMTPEGQQITWPAAFERILRSLTLPASKAKTRAQKRSASPDDIARFKPQSFHFEGGGSDVQENFLSTGWLNPLPPQSGIPGWQRMTMMKYFENEDTGHIDTDALWAYEGVVLPGGQIVIGRWWSPNHVEGEEVYSGPFILWCVDGLDDGLGGGKFDGETSETSGSFSS